MKKTMTRDRIIMNAEANMRAEGFIVTNEVKHDCYAMIKGKKSANVLVSKYIAQYAKK